MNIPCAIQLFGQAAEMASAAASTPAALPAAAWWREPWAVWGMTLLTVAVPTMLSWLLSKRLRAADMWGRVATVLVALTAGAVIAWLGWPPRLGIDLKGGVILVYEVDAAGQSAGQVGEVAGRIEQLIATEQAASGSRVSVTGNRITVRLTATDAVAREALEKGIGGLDFGEAGVRRVGRKTTGDTVELDYDVAGGAAAVDMDKLVAAVSRRVNPGGQKEVTVRRYGLDQLEVIVPEVDQSEVELIKRVVSSAGVLEFRITANDDDPRHKQVIELARRSPGTTVTEGGRQIGRWVQLDTAKINPAEDGGLITRRMPDGRVEVLVVLDRFDVTGGYLSRASSSYDSNLQPCVNFS
ncbi:MAG: hypothetical protein EBX36_06975, partial [Planctomycetia bacterium]|nr:hypothetical protein [Planctomycetia bacterium]